MIGREAKVLRKSRSVPRRDSRVDLEDESLLTALLDNIPGCLALLLRRGTREIVASNKQARELGAIPGETCFGTCAELSRPCPFCLAPELWKTGEPQETEVEHNGVWYRGVWKPLSADLYAHYIFDITERRRMEESLLRTQWVVDHSEDFVHWVGPEGNLLYVNEACCRRLGYSREELLGMTVYDIDPTIPQPWRERFESVRRKGSLTFESFHRTKDGELFPVEVTVTPVSYNGQEYNCSTSRDISDRKQIEKALREGQKEIQRKTRFLESILENAGTCMAVLKGDELRYEVVNRAYQTLAPGVEMLGRTLSEVLPEAAAAGVEEGLRHVLATGEPWTIERYRAPVPGRLGAIWAGQIVRLPRDDGEEPSVLVAIWDVTERAEAEEALRLARFSIDFASDCTSWLDRGGRILDISESACARLGYTRDELLDMTVFDFSPGLSRESWPEHWRQLREQGSLTFEDVKRTKSGQLFPVEISAAIFEHGGREYNVGIMRDITERKAAEAALRKSEERLRQSEKMQAVGQLAGGIAHDFNNLLTAILGYSDLLLASPEVAGSSARRDIEEVKKAAERASALTKQILAFSRRQTLRPQVVSLNEVLDGMEPLLSRTLGSDIDFRVEKDPHLGFAEVDVHQFERVIMNLVVNARDAMPCGGRLRIATGNAELDKEYCIDHPESEPGEYVLLLVSDTGLGMDESTRARVFEPFFTTKPPGEGTGMGLATVYGIVRQSNGSVRVESRPGIGTCFSIYLPRVEPVARPEEAPRPAPALAAGGGTVLVVEDEAPLRGLVERVLTCAGYEVICLSSAAEALSALKREDLDIDLLLTDVMLPGPLQGNDLARAVFPVRPNLRVLFMSGYTRDALVSAGRLDEGVNLLEKPFSPDTLVAAVERVIDRSQDSFNS